MSSCFVFSTTAVVTFAVFVIIYLCSQWVPILGCTQNPGGKKKEKVVMNPSAE